MRNYDPSEAHGEIESALAAGTFLLTGALNEEDSLKRQAMLEYLHGNGPTKRAEPVYVQVEVTHPITKNYSREVKVSGKRRYVGGSTRMPVLATKAGAIPLRKVTVPGVYRMSTEQAVWFLWEFGEATTRVLLKPDNGRRKAWCRELPMQPAIAPSSPSRPRSDRQAAAVAG